MAVDCLCSCRAGLLVVQFQVGGWCGSSLACAWFLFLVAGRSRSVPIPPLQAQSAFRSGDRHGLKRRHAGRWLAREWLGWPGVCGPASLAWWWP